MSKDPKQLSSDIKPKDRQCNDCEKWSYETPFYIRKQTGNYRSKCKKCTQKQNRISRQKRIRNKIIKTKIENRQCDGCRKWSNDTPFYFDKQYQIYNNKCNDCKNIERRKIYSENKERHCQYVKKSYLKHRTKRLDYSKKYAEKNRDKILEYREKTRNSHNKKARTWNRTFDGFLQYRISSCNAWNKKNGCASQITKEDILNLRERQNNRCIYTDVELIWTMDSGIYQMSIDRIDSNFYYTLDNIQLVCRGINHMKSNYSHKMFISLLENIANYKSCNHHKDMVGKTFYMKFYNMKRNARKHNYILTMTEEEVLEICKMQIGLCGLSEIEVCWHQGCWCVGSFDKIDSNGIYEPDNVQVTLWLVNRMKNKFSNSDAFEIIKLIRKKYGPQKEIKTI